MPIQKPVPSIRVMVTLSLTKKLKEGQLLRGFPKKQDNKEVDIDVGNLDTSIPTYQPPNQNLTWLSKIGKQLQGWGTCDNDIMSHKPTRQAWTEAVIMRREIPRSQEIRPEKQDVVGEQFQKLSDSVQGIKDHQVKKKRKRLRLKGKVSTLSTPDASKLTHVYPPCAP